MAGVVSVKEKVPQDGIRWESGKIQGTLLTYKLHAANPSLSQKSTL